MMRARGFTLLEVMVSAGIASVVALGVFALITGQVEGYNRQERVSNAQMLARSAMVEIVRRVTPTGLGIPGDWAIGPQSANNVMSGVLGTCPATDVLEVRARDPRGYWILGAGSSPTSLQMQAPAAMTTDLTWRLGSRLFVFSSVGHYSLVQTAAERAPGTTSVALNAAESQDLTQPGNADARATSQVYVVLVTRLRVVCSEPDHPVLVLEQDIDTTPFDGVVDVSDQVPIASDIEDFQVAYLIDADRDGVVTEADAVNHPSLAIDPNLLTPLDKLRAVKGVRVTLVARAKALQNTSNLPLVVEDHSPAQVPDAYVRRLLRQIIVFDNRDTTEPDGYMHLSNQVL